MITNPTPQRALRGHRPERPRPRLAASGEYTARLANRLTERDRWLARMLYEHKVLTSNQIATLAWPSLRAANLRLLQLYTWRVIDRFQPFITYGTAPMHYVLDVAGAAILAREDGIEPTALNYKHDRAIGLAHSLRLAHTVGVNAFFTALTHDSRRPDAPGQLTAWWSEARCTRHYGDIVRPDAYGRWQQHDTGAEFEWFLEFDFGTERPERVGAKLGGYAKLAATTGIITPVLVWMPTPDREVRVRRALSDALDALDDPESVPIATASGDLHEPEAAPAPGTSRWLPLFPNRSANRRSLTDLHHAWPQLPCLTADSTPGPDHSGHTPAAPNPCPPRPSARRPGR